jgi:hypothetical protein
MRLQIEALLMVKSLTLSFPSFSQLSYTRGISHSPSPPLLLSFFFFLLGYGGYSIEYQTS